MTLPIEYKPAIKGITPPAGAGAVAAIDTVDAAVLATDALGAVGSVSVTNGSNVATITKVVSGTFAVNQLFLAPGVPPGTVILSLGTSTGGVGTVNLSSNATATGSGTVTASLNVDYARAKRVSDATKLFKTRMGNIATPGDANGALVASDPNFNNLPSINVANIQANAGYTTDIVCPPSFTFILPMRMTAYRAVCHLFATAAQGTAFWMNNGGQLRMTAATGEAQYNVGVPNPWLALNTTYLAWLSLDATTKTFRFGTSTAVAGSHVATISRSTNTVAGDYARPLSYFTATTPAGITGNIGGWKLLSKAYANDGSAADNAIANLISSWKTAIGA